MTKPREYIRLPGKRYVTFGLTRDTLWLGKDHLLQVINRGYTEEYRRFYYRDIQAIIVRQTATGRVLNLIFGSIAAMNLLVLAFGWFVWKWEAVAMIPLAVATSFWLLLFIILLTAGPTCACHIRTAVQFEKLPSLFRLRAARKAITQLKAKVEVAQGSLRHPAPSSP
jgi:hypothetical protein